MVKVPFAWFGGKSLSVPRILPILRQYPHKKYIEPFGGSGAILLAKEPKFDVYNDLNENVVNFYRVLQDKKQYKELIRLVALTPYSRKNFIDSNDRLQTEKNPVKRAALWYCVARQSFGGKGGCEHNRANWSIAKDETLITPSGYYVSGIVRRWLNSIERLPEIYERLKHVQIEHLDAIDLMRRYACKDTLFYLDPPYVADTRKSGKYQHECDDDFHRNLVDTMLSVPGHKVLSGYESEIYQPLLDAEYTLKKREIQCKIAKHYNMTKEQLKRTECLYCSPLPKDQLLF